MAQVADNTLEARLLALEDQVRSLRAAAAVGGTSIGAEVLGAKTLTGVASTVGSVGWDTDSGPSVDLYVATGRIRVDVAASFDLYGNKASLFVGFQVRGPVDADANDDGSDEVDPGPLLAVAPVVVAPDRKASASLQDDGVGMNILGAFSTFDLVTGLAVGWYRVETAYLLDYSGTTGAPYGIATYRRLSVTRY